LSEKRGGGCVEGREVVMNHECEELQGTGQLEGRYANYFKVGHNAVEFLLDFGQFYSEREYPLLHTRIITNPSYVKVLVETIQESLLRYEREFGPVEGE